MAARPDAGTGYRTGVSSIRKVLAIGRLVVHVAVEEPEWSQHQPDHESCQRHAQHANEEQGRGRRRLRPNAAKTAISNSETHEETEPTCISPASRIASRGKLMRVSIERAAFTVLSGLLRASTNVCQMIVPTVA